MKRHQHHYGRNLFARFANLTAELSGHPLAFISATAIVAGWLLTGPIFHYSDTWQLVINTATTIVTFLMVFLIQNAQNRSAYATQIKLDEIIRALEGAHNALLNLEELTDEDIGRMRKRYRTLAEEARAELQQGLPDTGRPDVPQD